jgi:ATP-dependent DNA helicase PIF1
VLLTAPTATAAFNIGGTTLHQAFSLSKSLPLPYIYKRDDELNKLRSKLQYLNILIIDEISMVGQRMLLYVSERLRQIKQSGNALFGNISVIAVGDFYQLPPVKQKTLYDLRPVNYFPLWSLHFSIVSLSQIMRQKDDAPFAELLNRLRLKTKSQHLIQEDCTSLQSCEDHLVPPETLTYLELTKKCQNTTPK